MSKETSWWIIAIYISMIIVILYANRRDGVIMDGMKNITTSLIGSYTSNDAILSNRISSLEERVETNKALLKQLLDLAISDDDCLKEIYPKPNLLSPDVKLLCVNDKWAVIDVSEKVK